MMNRYKYKIIASVLAATFVLGACTAQEDVPVTAMSGTLALQLQLSLPAEMEIVTTRGEDATVIEVKDVWVIQYIAANTDGTASKMTAKYYTEGITLEDNKYKVATSSDFMNEDSEFYIITNAGTHAGLSNLGESSDLSALKACVMKITENSLALSNITAEPGILVAGPVKFVKKGVGTNIPASVSAHLQRANAKVSVTWNVASDIFTNATFTATSLTVENLPKTISFFERAGAESGTYPEMNDISTDAISFNDVSTGLVTFYMAENLRGIGTSNTAQEKNLIAKGPISSENNSPSLAGCTCITLSGSYKYNASHTGAVGVKYRFYLGGNLINDYNIRRGYAYALNITVSGVNSADLRVTITNGNVAIFDQVTEIGEIEVEI